MKERLFILMWKIAHAIFSLWYAIMFYMLPRELRQGLNFREVKQHKDFFERFTAFTVGLPYIQQYEEYMEDRERDPKPIRLFSAYVNWAGASGVPIYPTLAEYLFCRNALAIHPQCPVIQAFIGPRRLQEPALAFGEWIKEHAELHTPQQLCQAIDLLADEKQLSKEARDAQCDLMILLSQIERGEAPSLQ